VLLDLADFIVIDDFYVQLYSTCLPPAALPLIPPRSDNG
jgi:hypothetical protein